MFCAQCNLFLLNHQADGSFYTKLRFQLCEENAKLHKKICSHNYKTIAQNPYEVS
jgi:hypothetical protein